MTLDGRQQHMDMIQIRDPFRGDVVTMLPGESRIIGPAFNYTYNVYSQMDDSTVFFGIDDLAKGLASATISATLDGVVSDDDSFSGADGTWLSMRYACYARAAADMGAVVNGMIAGSLPISTVKSQMSSYVEPGLIGDGTFDVQSLYTDWVGYHAQTILQLIGNTGGQGLGALASGLYGSGPSVKAKCAATSTVGGTNAQPN